MDDFSVREERDFHNLTAKPRRMHLLDEPSGYISALAKDCLAHQMRFSVGRLESELLTEGTPHVLQIAFEGGDDRTPAIWTLYADGDDEWSSGENARNLPGYEEWYEIGLLVIKTIVPGPNKDPRYRCIDISRKHMPCRVTAGDTVLYEE